jgi:hypothetical protein
MQQARSGQALQIAHSDGRISNAIFPKAIDPLPEFTRISCLGLGAWSQVQDY